MKSAIELAVRLWPRKACVGGVLVLRSYSPMFGSIFAHFDSTGRQFLREFPTWMERFWVQVGGRGRPAFI